MWGDRAKVRNLVGFENALAAVIEEATAAVPPLFRFTHPGLKDLILNEGVHIHLQGIPAVEDIQTDNPLLEEGNGEGGPPARREPAIGIFTEPGSGVLPSASLGGRHEWMLRFILRAGTISEDAKQQLEELVVFLTQTMGPTVGEFSVVGTELTGRPRVTARQENDQPHCEATVRFMVVPTT